GPLVFSPASVDFGDINVHEARTQRVVMRNASDAPLRLPGFEALRESPPFHMEASCPEGTLVPGDALTLPAGASCELTVGFGPFVSGDAAFTLTVDYESAQTGTAALAVSGAALEAVELILAHAELPQTTKGVEYHYDFTRLLTMTGS